MNEKRTALNMFTAKPKARTRRQVRRAITQSKVDTITELKLNLATYMEHANPEKVYTSKATPKGEAKLPFVRLKIGSQELGHHPVFALTDSGCSHSIVSADTFQALPDMTHIPYRQLPRPRKIKLAGNCTHDVRVLGVATLHLKFETADNTFFILKHDCQVVTNVHYDFFIGGDILRTNTVKLQTPQVLVVGDPTRSTPNISTFILNNELQFRKEDWKIIPIEYHDVSAKANLLAMHKVTLLPKETRIVITRAEVPLPMHQEEAIYTIKPTFRKAKYYKRLKVQEARGSIADPGYIPMVVKNITNNRVVINQDSKLAMAEMDTTANQNLERVHSNDLSLSIGERPRMHYATNKQWPVDSQIPHQPQLMSLEIRDTADETLPPTSALNKSINKDKFKNWVEKKADVKTYDQLGYYTRSASNILEEKGVIQSMEKPEPVEQQVMTDEEILEAIDLKHLDHGKRAQARNMLKSNLGVFTRSYRDVGRILDFEATVELREDRKTLQQRYIPLPISAREEVGQILDQFQELDLIEDTKDLDPYISNLLITKKKDGHLRILADREEGRAPPNPRSATGSSGLVRDLAHVKFGFSQR
jgi:hypothetical protein